MYKPVFREIYSDMVTPIEVMRKLKNVSRQCFIFESVENNEKWGRYTFLGYNPTMEIDSDIERVEQIIAEYYTPKVDGLPPFMGGLAGYFTYEKEFKLMLFDKIIAFDNLKQKIVLMAKTNADLDEMQQIITIGKPAVIPELKLLSPFKKMFSENEFCRIVEKTQEYINNGEVEQVVLSNLNEADACGSLFDAYRVLRTINPSPYMFCFEDNDLEIVGASPETLLKLTDGLLRTFPIGGTRPRGLTDEEDSDIEQELLSDPKEITEHDMLVELGKADLNKISISGSVKVEDYMAVKKYSHVMHLTSAVTGRIRENITFAEAINAVLPAGTLSGAPREKALEIISELEKNKRGIYGGAIGYISFTGDMDFCISIRLAFKKDNKVYVRSGAGVVAQSVPQNEYTECVNKAQAVITALNISNGGIDND
ncbi:MAG: anthranilate synthase component I family protein [Oscillospiraceae bacterium]|nr:anthranilate synthase component I family protein [Oscillospiraceae bacterium]